MTVRKMIDGARGLASDSRVPRPIKALLVFGLLPIPGPFEEIAGGLAVLWLVRRRPQIITDHFGSNV